MIKNYERKKLKCFLNHLLKQSVILAIFSITMASAMLTPALSNTLEMNMEPTGRMRLINTYTRKA